MFCRFLIFAFIVDQPDAVQAIALSVITYPKNLAFIFSFCGAHNRFWGNGRNSIWIF